MDAAPLAGRDESRPYGTRKKFLMPWMDAAPLAGRDESRPYGISIFDWRSSSSCLAHAILDVIVDDEIQFLVRKTVMPR
jgi:hypothetical protein